MNIHRNIHKVARKARTVQTRECLYCGKKFKTANPRRDYCTTTHAKYASAARIAEQARKYREQNPNRSSK